MPKYLEVILYIITVLAYAAFVFYVLKINRELSMDNNKKLEKDVERSLKKKMQKDEWLDKERLKIYSHRHQN